LSAADVLSLRQAPEALPDGEPAKVAPLLHVCVDCFIFAFGFTERMVHMIRQLLVATIAIAVIGCESDNKERSQNQQPASSSASVSASGSANDKSTDFRAETASAKMEAQVETPNAMNANTMDAAQFVQQAASSGLFEVKAGELAKQRATSDNTKHLGDMIIEEHKKANDDLMKITQRKNIPMPTDLQPNEKATFDKLTAVNGADFDGQFLHSQVQGHQQAIDLFEKASKSLQDKDLKEFAQQYLPMLREHLKMAQEYASMVSTPDQKAQPQNQQPQPHPQLQNQ
jgi:putative membrane protein